VPLGNSVSYRELVFRRGISCDSGVFKVAQMNRRSHAMQPRSAVPLLDQALITHARKLQSDTSSQQLLRAARTTVQTRSLG
jgi:hypothetical protein